MICFIFDVKFLCVNITPLALPVVPFKEKKRCDGCKVRLRCLKKEQRGRVAQSCLMSYVLCLLSSDLISIRPKILLTTTKWDGH